MADESKEPHWFRNECCESVLYNSDGVLIYFKKCNIEKCCTATWNLNFQH